MRVLILMLRPYSPEASSQLPQIIPSSLDVNPHIPIVEALAAVFGSEIHADQVAATSAS